MEIFQWINEVGFPVSVALALLIFGLRTVSKIADAHLRLVDEHRKTLPKIARCLVVLYQRLDSANGGKTSDSRRGGEDFTDPLGERDSDG
jgi:hypothetical protein